MKQVIRKHSWILNLGARYVPKHGVHFLVWAPRAKTLAIEIIRGLSEPARFEMKKDRDGYFSASVSQAKPGDRYYYCFNQDKKRPDPVSRFQPDGVHGPSEIVDPHAFRWTDGRWKGIAHDDLIFYELHIGTFTPEGTFDAAVKRLPHLKKLGITCVEVMPVAQFPGRRNWGYDGVGLYAVQNSYGGPAAFKRFVDACHKQGLAVCLDVVYNHLGPEGNYLHDYGPYFTHKHHTPWGDAVNYDDRESAHVRRYVIENALFWISEYHVDTLRLDAVHGIVDDSSKHILAELGERVKAAAKKMNRQVSVIAESDLNDVKLVKSRAQGGYALDAHWSDDFHHAVHVMLTGEQNGYYQDFTGLRDVAKALDAGFVYDGILSRFRGKKHGTPSKELRPDTYVVCTQNHDQIGNRALGDRLSASISFQAQKATAALLMLSPYLPLIFMGQEFGDTSPFQYFIDHGDPHLIDAVRRGRKHEFREFKWEGEIPDPYAESTFERSKIQWNFLKQKPYNDLLKLYQDLIGLRKLWGLPKGLQREYIRVHHNESQAWIALEYRFPKKKRWGILCSFAQKKQDIPYPFADGTFEEMLHTESLRYGGFLKSKNGRYKDDITLYSQSAMAGRIIF